MALVSRATLMIPATELRRYSFLWIPKVTFRPFSTFVLHGLGPNPAAVRMFRRSSSKATHVLKEGRFSGFGITSDISDSSYRAQALCFSMDSKGNVGPFFRVCFAWPGTESCCSSNVSEALFQGHTTKTACLYLV